MEGVTRMLDEGKNVDINYLDFDKVPHHRLIGKVASMGVEGMVKGWGECKEWSLMDDIQIGQTLQVVSRRDRSSVQLSAHK